MGAFLWLRGYSYKDKTSAGQSNGAGPQEEPRSTSAAGPSSRVESLNLNQFPNLRERERDLVEELEEIDKVVDQLHAQASSIHSEAELQASAKNCEEIKGWIDRTERTLSELATQAEERSRERAAAALRPAEVAEVVHYFEQQRRLRAEIQVRVDQIARDQYQYERDRARARGF